jgi:hypothetical protein
MRKHPVTRRQFLGSGIAAAGAISIGGALPANARDWEEYSAGFDRSISDVFPAGPLRPDDETASQAVSALAMSLHFQVYGSAPPRAILRANRRRFGASTIPYFEMR